METNTIDREVSQERAAVETAVTVKLGLDVHARQITVCRQDGGQVASYTGLCPSEQSSGQSRRQGRVSKHGNPRVRHALVEVCWRLLLRQPDYPPLEKLRAATGKRARKRAVVAAARRLAINLWRLKPGQCTAGKLGLQLR